MSKIVNLRVSIAFFKSTFAKVLLEGPTLIIEIIHNDKVHIF